MRYSVIRLVALLAAVSLLLSGCALPGRTAQLTPTPTRHLTHQWVYGITADSIYAMDVMDGVIVWRSDIPGERAWVITSNPEVVVVSIGDFGIRAYGAHDGSLRWDRSDRWDFVYLTGDGAVFRHITNKGSSVEVIDALTGEVRWHWDTPRHIEDVEVSQDDLLVAQDDQTAADCVAQADPYAPAQVVLLDSRTGATRRTMTLPVSIVGTSILDQSELFWTTSQDSRCIRPHTMGATDIVTGTTPWHHDLSQEYNLMTVTHGILYAVCDSCSAAFRSSDGIQLWQDETAHFQFEGATDHSVFMARWDVHPAELIALEATNGTQRWALSTSAPTVKGLGIVGISRGTLYGFTEDWPSSYPRTFVALDEQSGHVAWMTPLQHIGPVVFTSDRVLIAQAARGCALYSDVTVTALDIATGHRLWERVLPKRSPYGTPTPTIHARELC